MIPPAAGLPWWVAAGRECFACGKRLTVGAVLVGRAQGKSGVHDLSTDVYACP